jgi:6-pyruvoyltetrahydropterin/6-carboxytetrahydropterin synthase
MISPKILHTTQGNTVHSVTHQNDGSFYSTYTSDAMRASETRDNPLVANDLLYVAASGFESACQVNCLPAHHRAARLHGHSFMSEVRARLPKGWAPFAGAEVSHLHEALSQQTAALDYQYINDVIALPTDENIARWLRNKLDVPGIETVGVQSTAFSGVDLDQQDHAHLWRKYIFQAAHQLPNVSPSHKCGRMHGHGFEVILHADQDLGSRDFSIDYDIIDALWAPLHAQLHLTCLNDIDGLDNPTSEHLSAWIWARLKPQLPELSWVTVYETGSCGAHFDGAHYRIWKELTLDSAVQLKRAPHGDPRRRIHGHTFTLRLHLHAPLNRVQGWTVDFGDVKTIFDPIFKSLDHYPLHEIMGDQDTDTASVARYIRTLAQPVIPELDRIDLNETRGCGVILHWGELGPALPV